MPAFGKTLSSPLEGFYTPTQPNPEKLQPDFSALRSRKHTLWLKNEKAKFNAFFSSAHDTDIGIQQGWPDFFT